MQGNLFHIGSFIFYGTGPHTGEMKGYIQNGGGPSACNWLIPTLEAWEAIQ